MLALHADAPGDPPARRVVIQQRFGHRLQHVDQIVVAPDVRQLVGDDRLELGRRQAAQRAGGQHHDRSQPAHHEGHLHHRGMHDLHRAPDSQPPHQDGGAIQHCLRHGRHRGAPQAREPHPRDGQAGRDRQRRPRTTAAPEPTTRPRCDPATGAAAWPRARWHSADARTRIAGVRSPGPAGPSSTGAGCAITTRTARGSSVEFMTSAVPIQAATIAASPRHATTYRA